VTEAVPGASPHQAAADEAVAHLQAALTALQAAYDHPHHSPRLDNVEAQIASLISVIEPMPGWEASRADHAARLMKAYRERTLDQVVPFEAGVLLDQELARQGNGGAA
jgi:hypothetical protein